MIRLRTLVLSLLSPVFAVAACSDGDRNDSEPVELTPKEPKPSVPEPIDASVGSEGDASAPATPIGADFDAGTDAATDAAAANEPCPPVGTTPSTGARYAFAVRARAPRILDGDLADWRRCVAIKLEAANAARVEGTPLAVANIYLEWEPDALWVGAEVGDVFVEGDDPLRPFMNDSLEIYVSGTGLRTGDYGPLDHQYVVDHRGLARAYAGGKDVGAFGSAVVATTPTGYRMEMRIPASELASKPLEKGDVKFVDVLLNDSTNQSSFMIWAMQPHAACSCATCICNKSPAFDTLLLAPITLK